MRPSLRERGLYWQQGGGYDYDLTTIRLQLDRATTIRRPTLRPSTYRLRNDLYCDEWDVKLYYTIPYHTIPYRRRTSRAAALHPE